MSIAALVDLPEGLLGRIKAGEYVEAYIADSGALVFEAAGVTWEAPLVSSTNSASVGDGSLITSISHTAAGFVEKRPQPQPSEPRASQPSEVQPPAAKDEVFAAVKRLLYAEGANGMPQSEIFEQFVSKYSKADIVAARRHLCGRNGSNVVR